MAKKPYAVKLSTDVLKELKVFCHVHGYNQSSFVERALREQMLREEMKEDIYDLVSLRSQEGVAESLASYHHARKK